MKRFEFSKFSLAAILAVASVNSAYAQTPSGTTVDLVSISGDNGASTSGVVTAVLGADLDLTLAAVAGAAFCSASSDCLVIYDPPYIKLGPENQALTPSAAAIMGVGFGGPSVAAIQNLYPPK
jgi:hypothetical protein